MACSSKGGPPRDSGTDSARADAQVDSGEADSGAEDAGAEDSAVGSDAGSDAGDASSDGGSDSGSDAAMDAPPGECGETTCGAEEYCDYADDCGAAGGGTCMERPIICTADCPGVCGCDGRIYCNACIAASMGIDVDPEGDCSPPGDCDAYDVRGEGLCRLILGYAWDGEACGAISGCSCAGRDCPRLHETEEECVRAHASCALTSCAAMDARGEGLCDAFFGYAWNGRECMGLSGCSCVGRDCGRAFESLAECNAAFDECGTSTGRACGARLGDTCARDEYCDFPGSICDFADATGVCTPRPVLCSDEDRPVCGCDGETYGNPCIAHRAGTDFSTPGACEE